MNYSAFDGLRDVVVVFDDDGSIAYRNAAAAAVIGESPMTWADCFTAERAATELVWTVDGGTRRTFEANVSRQGGASIVVAREITRFMRAEERLRKIEQLMVDTQGVAHLGTWEWDIRQPNASWSAELYRIYGLTPETYSPTYEAYLTMVHPEDRQRVIDATNRVFHERVPYSHDERIFRPDGTIRYLHTWAYPLLDEAGALTHLIGVCQDITDRALADLALQEANAELERRVSERTAQLESALRDLEGFNAMVSHDLRAPLAVIQMSVELIGREAGGELKSAKYFERILRSIEAMSRLLDDLLTFARVGEAALAPCEVDATSLCTEIASELQAMAPDRAATVVIEPNLTIIADPKLFKIVLDNLLGNAWKYTQRVPAAQIEVGTAHTADGPALFVRDNGVGFNMAEYPDLFVPFKRLATARDFQGTGIGLATVQRILERHGGRISADSQPDHGATFFVHLPRA